MATTHRRRGKSLNLDLSSTSVDDRPPLSALFLVQFDVKAGYTIAWKRSEPDLDLQDSVEFKSLPSGLHNVQEDLIYFMHGDDHAGISAFVNRSTDKYARNSLMLAVGALVPLEQGRLGRSWKHATDLKKIAQELVQDPTQTAYLEKYWMSNHVSSTEKGTGKSESESSQPNARRPSLASSASQGKRGRSGSTYMFPSAGLSPYHPARSIPILLDNFGPLIFPLFKAAILRKRILLISEAPIEVACNFVYDISIISNIPSGIAELIPLEPLPSRLQPLFSIGVHDIDDLKKRGGGERDVPSDEAEDDDLGYGWIACTTDDVLGMKSDLYDLVVNLPPRHTKDASERVWPVVKTSAGQEIKASQRDSRRYRAIRRAQKRSLLNSRSTSPGPDQSLEISDDVPEGDDDDDQASLIKKNILDSFDDTSSVADDALIEPMSWSALAYNSFMWWASAGEKRADLEEEAEHDASMFRNLETHVDRPGSSSSRKRSSSNPSTPGAMSAEGITMPPEMAVIAYFHRFTTVMIERLAELVDSADSAGTEEATSDDQIKKEDERGLVFVSSDDVRHMGLDVWSESDRRFLEEMVEFYFGQKAEVQGGHVECCGVRIV